MRFEVLVIIWVDVDGWWLKVIIIMSLGVKLLIFCVVFLIFRVFVLVLIICIGIFLLIK